MNNITNYKYECFNTKETFTIINHIYKNKIEVKTGYECWDSIELDNNKGVIDEINDSAIWGSSGELYSVKVNNGCYPANVIINLNVDEELLNKLNISYKLR